VGSCSKADDLPSHSVRMASHKMDIATIHVLKILDAKYQTSLLNDCVRDCANVPP
jgi:hypothetical protein